MKPVRDYHRDLIEDLRNPAEASAYLNAALEAGDKQAFLMALRNVLDAQGGMTSISERADMNRVSLYKMLSAGGNPGFENIMRLLQIAGVQFQIVPKARLNSRKKAA